MSPGVQVDTAVKTLFLRDCFEAPCLSAFPVDKITHRNSRASYNPIIDAVTVQDPLLNAFEVGHIRLAPTRWVCEMRATASLQHAMLFGFKSLQSWKPTYWEAFLRLDGYIRFLHAQMKLLQELVALSDGLDLLKHVAAGGTTPFINENVRERIAGWDFYRVEEDAISDLESDPENQDIRRLYDRWKVIRLRLGCMAQEFLWLYSLNSPTPAAITEEMPRLSASDHTVDTGTEVSPDLTPTNLLSPTDHFRLGLETMEDFAAWAERRGKLPLSDDAHLLGRIFALSIPDFVKALSWEPPRVKLQEPADFARRFSVHLREREHEYHLFIGPSGIPQHNSTSDCRTYYAYFIFLESLRQQLLSGQGLSCPLAALGDEFCKHERAKSFHLFLRDLWERHDWFPTTSHWRSPPCIQ